MTIYIDLFILENCIVNYFLMYLMCKTMNIRYSILYNTISALVGSLFCVFMIKFSFNVTIQILLKVLVGLSMVFISTRRKDKELIKGFLILFLYTIVLGGICMFLKFNETGVIPKNSYIVDFTYKKLMLAIIILVIGMNRIVIFIKDKLIIKNLIYDVEINIGGDCKRVKAFLDTGNELREPVTNLPVIIIQDDIFQEISVPSNKEYFINYKAVNGEKGILKGVRPYSVNFIKENKIKETKDAIVAFCNTNLSKTGEYNALLSRGIL